jgi:hypothetical protein
MAIHEGPTVEDRAKAIQVALSGIADDLELGELAALVECGLQPNATPRLSRLSADGSPAATTSIS